MVASLPLSTYHCLLPRNSLASSSKFSFTLESRMIVLSGRLGCDVTCTHSSRLFRKREAKPYKLMTPSTHKVVVYTEIVFTFACLYNCFASLSIVSRISWLRIKILCAMTNECWSTHMSLKRTSRSCMVS